MITCRPKHTNRGKKTDQFPKKKYVNRPKSLKTDQSGGAVYVQNGPYIGTLSINGD